MTTRSWLTRLFAPRRPRTIRTPRPRCRPTLEPLENRWLPAITVNTLADTFDGSITDGTISLRDAIANSPAGGVINFSVTGTINLMLGPVVLQDVDLEGPGASLLTINANDHFGVFHTSNTTTIAGVTITGGGGGSLYGGGILDEVGSDGVGNLTVVGSLITGNSAAYGGGIACVNNNYAAECSVTLVNSTVSGNSANSLGGGIYGDVSLIKVHESTISNNSVHDLHIHEGVAIYCLTGELVMTNSTVSNNGGGSCIYGGIGAISNSTIAGNGFAIAFVSGVVVNSTIVDNADGIYSPGGASILLDNSIVAGNQIDIDGFADLGSRNNLIGSTNTSTESDAGVGGPPAGGLVNGVNGNIVDVPDPGVGPLADYGGPTQTCLLLNFSPAVNAGDNAVIPTDWDSGLPLTTDQTGAPRVFGGTIDIGSVELQAMPAVPSTVVNTPTDNVATNGLTSLRAAVAFASRTGGTVTFDPTVFATPQTLPLVFGPIIVSGMAGPVTIAGPGAGLATVDAGGVNQVFRTSGTATVSGLTITGGGGESNGAITNDDAGMLTISDCVIRGNSNCGVANSGSLTIDDSIISGNTGRDMDGEGGGGICSVSQDIGRMVTISNSTITGNSAMSQTSLGGGGIFSKNPLSIYNSTISSNTSLYLGGGIYSFATVTLVNSTVSGNSAVVDGGLLIYATATITNSTISGNTANGNGGLEDTGFLTIINSTIANNSTTFDRAGITGVNGNITLLDSIVAGNRANGTPWDVDGSLNSASAYNLIGDAAYSGGLVNAVNANIVGADPLLGPLADNGGPTQTQALLPGSPASNAADPTLPPDVPTDQRGRPRVQGGRMDIGAVEMAVPPTVVAVQVNDGSAQRSEVRSLTVTFSDVVSFFGGSGNAAAAFQLSQVGGGGHVGLAGTVSLNASGQTVVVLTFTNANTAVIDPVSGGPNFSLADGRYQLIIAHSLVTGEAGSLDGKANGTASNYVSPTDTLGGGPGQLHLYRLFGDAAGDGIVDQLDLAAFRTANNSSSGSPAYLSFLDAVNSGTIDQLDLAQFRTRNNSSVFPTGPVVTPGGGGGHQSPSATPPPPAGPAPFEMPDTFAGGVILSGSVTRTNGLALNGRGPSGNYVSPTDTRGGGPGQHHPYRLLGDAAGDGIVDQIDLGQLQSTFNANSTGLFYLSFLDAAGNSVVDARDLGQFHNRFNANVF